ncbi:MAG: hypothetical protein OK422_01995 [Thaumarchaeota archaeon]|nr:hypothetical protein [Nitrososphaerota archaeon]
MKARVSWAILSDKYGVWFPDEQHVYYEKKPDDVTNREFELLKRSFNDSLKNYREIWFYYDAGNFHPIFKRVVEETDLRQRIHKFNSLKQIS